MPVLREQTLLIHTTSHACLMFYPALTKAHDCVPTLALTAVLGFHPRPRHAAWMLHSLAQQVSHMLLAVLGI